MREEGIEMPSGRRILQEYFLRWYIDMRVYLAMIHGGDYPGARLSGSFKGSEL